MAQNEYLQGEVVEDFADGRLTRREALRRLGLLGLGVTAATALLAACADNKADVGSATPAPSSAPASPSAVTGGPTAEGIRFAGPAAELRAAWAAAAEPKGALLVIHENRGLTPHFSELVVRFARVGYSALAVDLVSREGGTPALGGDAEVQAALGAADDDRLLADLRASLDELQKRAPQVKIGAIGFCFGGGMVWRLLQSGEPRIAAAVPFYGSAPDEPDFTSARAAVLGIYAGLDARVNASRPRAEAALKAARLTYEIKTYDGAEHAFFNNTGARYNERAAQQAQADLLAWLDDHLA